MVREPICDVVLRYVRAGRSTVLSGTGWMVDLNLIKDPN